MKHEPGFILTAAGMNYLTATDIEAGWPRAAPAIFPYPHPTLAQLPNMGRPQ